MKYTNTAVTVYNRYIHPQTGKTVFKPTVLRDVFWEQARGTNLTHAGANVGGDLRAITNVMIWPSRLRDTQGRQYLPPKAYARLSPEAVDGHWTLSDEMDRLVYGAVDGAVETADIGAVAKEMDHVIKIGSVVSNLFGPMGMRHWVVSGAGA